MQCVSLPASHPQPAYQNQYLMQMEERERGREGELLYGGGRGEEGGGGGVRLLDSFSIYFPYGNVAATRVRPSVLTRNIRQLRMRYSSPSSLLPLIPPPSSPLRLSECFLSSAEVTNQQEVTRRQQAARLYDVGLKEKFCFSSLRVNAVRSLLTSC